jgi:hypothetical protein
LTWWMSTLKNILFGTEKRNQPEPSRTYTPLRTKTYDCAD